MYEVETQLDFVASRRKTFPGPRGPRVYACIAPDMERLPPPKGAGQATEAPPKK